MNTLGSLLFTVTLAAASIAAAVSPVGAQTTVQTPAAAHAAR